MGFSSALQGTYEEDEAHAIFLIVVSHVLDYNRTDYLLNKERELTDAQYLEFDSILMQLKTGRPVQYILKETVFYGLPFKVTESVLIPRPETEELVDWILETAGSVPEIGSLIDIGTGSGCIAVSFKKNLPAIDVIGLDVSEKAIEIASANAILNEVVIDFIKADIRNFRTEQKFDIVVSNPPYITIDEKEEMHRNVLENEPHLALFVSNERPLIFYECIADFALQSLNKDGMLFFEINEHFGKETVDMLASKSFTNIVLRKDMQGKDRMICCKLS